MNVVSANESFVVKQLQAILPAHCIITDPRAKKPFETDGLTAVKQMPWSSRCRRSEAQVGAVLRVCHALGVPVVRARRRHRALGRRAAARADGVLLGLAKFNRILAIDRLARTARSQPGVRNLADQRSRGAARPLLRARSVAARSPARIGGNVAENSGGVHCLKYGLTVHNVLRVRGFTLDGEAVEIGGDALDAPGSTCSRWWSASEGMLGDRHRGHGQAAAEAADARAASWPASTTSKTPATRSPQIIAAGIIPAGLEMMDKPVTAAVEGFVHAGYDLDAAAILLCESDGTAEEVEDEIARMIEVLRAPRRDADARSSERRGASGCGSGRPQERVPGRRPHQPRLHVHGLDHPAQAPGRHAGRHRARWKPTYGLRCVNVFHAGDGNLHPLILFDANEPDELQRAEALRRRDPRTLRRAWAAPSPASTASASRSSSRCACSSRRAELEQMSARQARPSIRHGPAQSRQGHADAGALRRVRPHARARAAGWRFPSCRGSERSRRVAALSATRRARARRPRRRNAPLRIRGGGTKDFYGDAARAASCSTRRRSSRHRRLRADRAGRHRARRHAARRARSAARRATARCWPSSRRTSRPTATARRHGRRRPVRPGAAPSSGGVRDYVLGARCSTAAASVLHFGGQVMKNVAGYDVSRLLAGSLGTLGVIARGLAQGAAAAAARDATLRFDIDAAAALAQR